MRSWRESAWFERCFVHNDQIMTEQIYAAVTHGEEETLRLEWSRGPFPQPSYCVKREPLMEAAKDAREALQELMEAGRQNRTSEYPSLLFNVAAKGYELYQRLFFGKDPKDKPFAERARRWIEGRDDGDTITFLVPSKLHIPWGLIYDQPPLAADGSDVHPENFWCLKFAATAQYSSIPPNGTDEAWPVDDFAMLFAAHEPLWQLAYSQLNGSEKQWIDIMLADPPQPSFRLNDIYNLWSAHKAKPHGLLSLYCHGSGRELLIGNDRISASDFDLRFARAEIDNQPPTLVFLAACQTAIGDLEGGFLDATSGEGFCGFVGTEVKVLDLFALRFLIRFLDRFFRTGETVREAILKLRSEHWPLSLAFSICCSGDLRLAPNDERKIGGAQLPSLSPTNLSYEPVSTLGLAE